MTRAFLSFDRMSYISHTCQPVLLMFQASNTTSFCAKVAFGTTRGRYVAGRHLPNPTNAIPHTTWRRCTYLDKVGCKDALSGAVLNTSVHRWACVTVKTAAATFGCEMHIYSKEYVPFLIRALTADNLPLCNKRFTACGPCWVGGIDTARVVLQRRAIQHFVCVERSTWVGLVESDELWFV
jgi:hypothetical protein